MMTLDPIDWPLPPLSILVSKSLSLMTHDGYKCFITKGYYDIKEGEKM